MVLGQFSGVCRDAVSAGAEGTSRLRLPVRAHRPARNAARSSRQACARRPGGRTPVQSARRVPRLTSRLARQLAFLRKPMTAHGVPLLRRGINVASCATPPPAMLAAPCGSRRVRRRRAAGRGAMTRPSLHPPPGARRPAGRAPPPRRASAEPAPDGVGLAARNAPGGGTRLVSPRMRRLRHSRRAQGGTPPACEADGDDAGVARRESDVEAQRRRSRRPPSASRRRERIRRRIAPRPAGRRRRMRRGADLAASAPEGRAVKPRTGDGALRRCKGCARSGRHAECPVEMDAARRPRPGGWTGVRRRGLRTMGCAISTGRRGAAAGARFQIRNTQRAEKRAMGSAKMPRPRRLTEYRREDRA